jgi:hypothetical protein
LEPGSRVNVESPPARSRAIPFSLIGPILLDRLRLLNAGDPPCDSGDDGGSGVDRLELTWSGSPSAGYAVSPASASSQMDGSQYLEFLRLPGETYQ